MDMKDVHLALPAEWPQLTNPERNLMIQCVDAMEIVNHVIMAEVSDKPTPSREAIQMAADFLDTEIVRALAKKIDETYTGKRPALVGCFLARVQ